MYRPFSTDANLLTKPSTSLLAFCCIPTALLMSAALVFFRPQHCPPTLSLMLEACHTQSSLTCWAACAPADEGRSTRTPGARLALGLRKVCGDVGQTRWPPSECWRPVQCPPGSVHAPVDTCAHGHCLSANNLARCHPLPITPPCTHPCVFCQALRRHVHLRDTQS